MKHGAFAGHQNLLGDDANFHPGVETVPVADSQLHIVHDGTEPVEGRTDLIAAGRKPQDLKIALRIGRSRLLLSGRDVAGRDRDTGQQTAATNSQGNFQILRLAPAAIRSVRPSTGSVPS